ncbi:MAG: RsmE family RNA methyltransferase [Candidatus Caenarcaniphilales bacterium]|nr:RsmE family RNA methyltransferase [Candidatus Caenarcaniphilales bacterium]
MGGASHHQLARFLVEDLTHISDPDQIHQIRQVLRLKTGDRIICLSEGKTHLCSLRSITNLRIELEIIEYLNPPDPELPFELKVYLPLLKAQKIEWILQKGTELGVYSFHLTQLERCIRQDLNWQTKLPRWEKIIREAVEQSERVRLPKILPTVDITRIGIPEPSSLRLAFIERLEETDSAHDVYQILTQIRSTNIQSVSLITGPEGGFTDQELLALQEKEFRFLSLGRRILRAETGILAGISLVSAIGGITVPG